MDLPVQPDMGRPSASTSWADVVLAQTRHLVLVLGPDGVLLGGSQAAFDTVGADPVVAVGRPLHQVWRWRTSVTACRGLSAALAEAALGRTGTCTLPSTGEPVELTFTAVRGGAPQAPAQQPDQVVAVLVESRRTGPGPATADPCGSEPAEYLQLALDTAGMSLWTWDLQTDRVTWPGLVRGGPHRAATANGPDAAIARFVHPDDQPGLCTALNRARAEGAALDVEFRVLRPGGSTGWLQLRGELRRDCAGLPAELSGVLIDVTDRTWTRLEHHRLLQAERRSGRRAAALQRITAALSEAATYEQVAAVMAEESLRWLGADAARIELSELHQIAGTDGSRAVLVTRTAGVARLFEPGRADDHAVRIGLDLTSRGRHRGRWLLGWSGTDGQDSPGWAVEGWSVRGIGVGRRDTGPDWTGTEGLDMLGILATECAQALDRAELYEQQRDIATVLQRTLLPSGLPEIAGATVAARYQPGGQGVDVGGDWYDVIALPDGRTALVIGDVEGHSAAAAAVMGQVRNALRAYAMEGSPPAIVMERLNRLLARLRLSQLVTCCYLEFTPSDGTATVVLAGHPPPLVVTGDGKAEYVAAVPNLVLGVDESATYLESTLLLEPGAYLLLYTDGLVEAVSRSLPAGLAALRGWASGWDPDRPADELVETLIRRARDGYPVLDDVAVLALRYTPTGRAIGASRSVRRTFPLDPTSASAARRFVTDVLDQWGQENLVQRTILMASELVTNSVLHTSGELALSLDLDDTRLRLEVMDHSERLPTLQQPDPDAPGGRGLLIISALASDWGVEGRGDGKAVWFEVQLDQHHGVQC